ncbi:MDR/zinc-dependent alcohol dehydrogenase-like family protein [Chitinophaga parva]|nr:Zn-dependent oxidoreductase [Chitinophaga parva]
MKASMQAAVIAGQDLVIADVERPEEPAPGHVIIKMTASAINNGDKFFLYRPPLPGATRSLYNIRGVSGAGRVIATGEGVPARYQDRQVTLYRQLHYSEYAVGTWSAYVQVPYLDCAILPENAAAEDYAGSLVNIITPYAFLRQAMQEGHKAVIITAGNAATGRAMIGICNALHFPYITLVRNAAGKAALAPLDAQHVLVQDDADFAAQFTSLAAAMQATAVFEGVGGQLLNVLIPLLPYGTVVYSYGYLGDTEPLTVAMSMLALKFISIRPFSNFLTDTVKDPVQLGNALEAISRIIGQPHFKTRLGGRFTLEEIHGALAFKGTNGEKAVLVYP